MTSPDDYGWRIDALRRSERVQSPEFLARIVLVFAGTAAGVIFLEIEFLPYWLAAYYAAVSLEKYVLWRWPSARSRGFFRLLVCLSGLIAGIYASLPVYLWHSGGDTLEFAGMVLLIGGVLNVFLVRARVWQISAAYLVPLAMAFFAIAGDFYVGPGGGPAFWAAITLASIIAAYFLIALRDANATHRRHQETREQVLQARKVQAVAMLAGGISHDFNNLLAVVQGNLELMREPLTPSEREARVSEALGACGSGAALTRQLLSLGRTADVTPERIAPGEAVRGVERLVRRVVPASIGLDLKVESGLPQIEADGPSLQAALMNLAINARDAMPDGGTILFEVQATGEDSEALSPCGHVAITVADTGKGIPPEHQERIFEPFFTTKPKGQGTGLGLAMVEGFARQAGGHVEVKSRPGKGTRFTLFLPALPVAPDPAHANGPLLHPQAATGQPAG